MRKANKKRSLLAVVLAVMVMFTVLPVDVVKAADTYTLKCTMAKKQIIYSQRSLDLCLHVKLLKNGKEIDLKNKKNVKIKWTSSDESVVKIVNTCAEYNEYTERNQIYASICGEKKGTAIVTASYKGASCTYKITVKGATIRPGYTDEKTAYVPAGKSLALNIVGDGWDYEQVTFSSSNASVAKGLSDGIEKCIKGIKPGTATITAKSKLGKLKIKVVVLPKMSLQMKNFKTVTKNGKTVGYSLQVTNKSNKPFTVVEGVMGDSEGFSIGKVKGGKVVVKPGATKTVTFLVDFWEELDFLFEIARDGKLLDDFAPGIAVKYEGKTFAQWYDADGKTTSGSMYMGKWSTR